MNPAEVIASLKDQGLTVHVTHLRFPDAPGTRILTKKKLYDPISTEFLRPKWKLREMGFEIFPKGGRTVVVVEDKDGNEIASGVSYCNLLDDFSPHVGLQKALGRALSALNVNKVFA